MKIMQHLTFDIHTVHASAQKVIEMMQLLYLKLYSMRYNDIKDSKMLLFEGKQKERHVYIIIFWGEFLFTHYNCCWPLRFQ